MLDPLELEIEVVVNHLRLVLGIFGSSEGTVHALTRGTIFLAQFQFPRNLG